MPWRRVLANVLFPMEVIGRNDAAAKARAHEILKLVGLEGFERAYPRQLSGGMQQRVALCRAIIHEPSILLMDEPFGALDELTRLEMNDLLLDIRRVTGATVLFVTHSIAEAIYLSDRVVVFSKRPAVINLELDVKIPYPRSTQTRFLKEFTELERQAGIALGVVK
jgi:NitT/TauT family transport system ATP-binding protein